MAPRAVGASRGLGTQRLRAGLTSVAPTALGLGPETNQRRPTLQEAKDGAPAGGSHLTSKQIKTRGNGAASGWSGRLRRWGFWSLGVW